MLILWRKILLIKVLTNHALQNISLKFWLYIDSFWPKRACKIDYSCQGVHILCAFVVIQYGQPPVCLNICLNIVKNLPEQSNGKKESYDVIIASVLKQLCTMILDISHRCAYVWSPWTLVSPKAKNNLHSTSVDFLLQGNKRML